MPAKSLPLVSRPRVTVLIPAPSGWGRGIIKGITMYANRHGPWQLHVEAEGERRTLPRGWQGDGIIVRISTPAVARAMNAQSVPVVNVSAIQLDASTASIPRVCNDLRACGTIAACHLLDCGLRHFGYVGLTKVAYVKEHCDAFAAAVGEAGCGCHVYALGLDDEMTSKAGRLSAWLRGLPKPRGFGANDAARLGAWLESAVR